jgi:hypothetical protein
VPFSAGSWPRYWAGASLAAVAVTSHVANVEHWLRQALASDDIDEADLRETTPP